MFDSPGTEAGIRLYLSEIVSLLSTSILSQTWSLKSQTARAMATVAQKLGAQLCPPYLDQLLAALLEGLSGRTWEGKVIQLLLILYVTIPVTLSVGRLIE